ncbi:MAG: hypothetical protein KC496_08650, partial [Anaerolineae bacterium]|nr:hypothetical protein [Anaerolineae bacterium]
FHAMAYRWFDSAMAWDELYSLVQHQVTEGDDAGMIPHMAYWQGGGEEIWDVPDRSIITQPPLIAATAWLVHEKHPNRVALAELYSHLVAYQEWFDRRRDLDGDHLVTLIHPWESGWDASPRWDTAMGLEQPTANESKEARHALVQILREHDCNAQTLRSAGSFAVKASDFNAIRAADCEAMSRIAAVLQLEDAGRWQQKARQIQQSVQAKCLHHDVKYWIAHDLSGVEEKAVSPDSAAKFVLLYGGCATLQQADALHADLLSPRYFTNFPVPTTPQDSPVFDGDTYWRGNVWLAVNWLIVRGLHRYQFTDTASIIGDRSLQLVEQAGFHEYFNPLTGTGYGPAQQSWSTIVIDFIPA